MNGNILQPLSRASDHWEYPAVPLHAHEAFNLADLNSRGRYQPTNSDFLDSVCRADLSPLDDLSLFNWGRHFTYQEASTTPIGNLCNLISLRIHDTWKVRVPGERLGNSMWRLMGRYRPGGSGQDDCCDSRCVATTMA